MVVRVRMDSKADFFGGERPVILRVKAGSDVNPGGFPMSIASRLSVVTAYIAFAFVGAIVLGVF